MAENKVYNGHSGGMMLHMGYLFGREAQSPYSMQGMVWGIGGALRVNLLNHLRIGSEGYVSNMPVFLTDQSNILKAGSFMRMGWGGILMDAYWRTDKAWPYIGATIGGGTMRTLYIKEGDQLDHAPEQDAMFHKESFAAVTPFVGCDYLLTEKVHLTFKLDWILGLNCHGLVQPTGPRLYVGFLFCH